MHSIYLLNGLKEYPDKLRTSFVGTYRSDGSAIAQICPESRMAHSIPAGQNTYSDSAGRLRPLFCDRLLRLIRIPSQSCAQLYVRLSTTHRDK